MLATLSMWSTGAATRGGSWRSVERRSSARIYSARVLFSSFDARLDSAMLFKSDFPNSRSLRGPKIISAMVKIMMSSGTPTEPIILELYPPEVCYDLPMRTRRFFPVAMLAVLLSALVGGFVGSSAQATQDQVSQQYRVFTAALAAIDREYVEDVPSDRLIYDAVGGMLQTLDPHSSFFDPKQYAQMRERQGGKYYAIGLSILALRGDMIVYTRGGVRDADQDYRATDEPNFTGPMMVLVNRNSASASEIVSGALQDHDRALVVGETTFGKALVQSVYRISEGAGLALTTGRYFTPSGRMIQRPWDNAFDEYLTYTLRDQTGTREHAAAQLKYTDAGRKVYGGGGIEPDKFFVGPVQGFNPTRFGRALVARSAFANFAERYTAEGDTRMSAATEGRKRLTRGFVISDAMIADFKASLQAEHIKVDEDAFAKDLEFVRSMIHYDIDVALFWVVEALT